MDQRIPLEAQIEIARLQRQYQDPQAEGSSVSTGKSRKQMKRELASPCRCGSGKKYWKCCAARDIKAAQEKEAQQ